MLRVRVLRYLQVLRLCVVEIVFEVEGPSLAFSLAPQKNDIYNSILRRTRQKETPANWESSGLLDWEGHCR